LFLVSTSSWSQETKQKYQFVNIKENVSKIGAYTIIQDHYGFIWMGTNGAGLNRFDGINYTSYKNKLNDATSLSNNNIYCSYKDHKNRLWFGTEMGLNLYDHKKDRFKRISFSEFGDHGANIAIRSLTEDNKGNLFVGTFELGLFKMNLDNFKVEKIVSQDPNTHGPITIISLRSGSNGKVYAGTDRGLKEFDTQTNTLKFSKFKTKKGIESIYQPIQSLLIANNNLWVGTTNDGLFKINKISNKENEFKSLDHFAVSENRIMSIIKLSDGTLMCSTENDGVFHLNADGQIKNHYLANKTDVKGIVANSIWCLFLDRNERIWLCYYNAGIGVYDNLYDKFNDIESLHDNSNSLDIGSVTAIAKDQSGNFWVGLDGGGIDVYNPQSNQFTHINSSKNNVFSGLTNDYIESLFIDSNQNIWAGSWSKGLFLLKKGAKNFVNYTIKNTNGDLSSDNVISMDEDSEGTIWFASWDKGLHSYNPNTNKFTHHKSQPFLKNGISDSYARKVLIDKKDNLWVATTDKGLFKIKKLKDGNFSIVSMALRMSKEFNNYATANHVLALYEGSNGLIWIGTRGAGLCKYNPATDKFTWYNTLNGLDAINITGIIEDLKGDIWLSSHSGIIKFDIAKNNFARFTKDDGLLSNDFNANANFKDNRGNIYFGNYLGIDYFDPSKISVNTILPSLYLTDFKLFNQSVLTNQKDSPLTNVIGETNSVILNHTQSVFTIEYTGINYTRPELNQYAYYLEGLEDSWNYVGSLKSATYTNLEPGNYTFKLKVANGDGKWTETPLTLKITVLPPWWKSNMALFAYFVLLVVGGYHFNRFMLNRLDKKKSLILEESKRVQEKDLNEQKFQFFTNISHEFRTPLTLIMNPINDIIRDDSLNLPARIREKHNIIYKNTDRLYRLINELLDFRKLELHKARVSATQFNLVDFTKNVASYFKEEAITNNIDLSLDADLMDIPVWADEKMLEKIIFNILSNAIKTTPKGGTINIDLQATDKLLILPLVSNTEPIKVVEISISDTGVGIDQEEVEKIFERFYQAKNLNNGYYGGTGIGLEVVREFVILHKGKIEVESAVGKGSIFKIILAAGNSHFKESEIATEKGEQLFKNENFTPTNDPIENEKTSTENQSSTKYTLLIVEDNTELREYLQNELGNDYKVLTAENGKKGLEIAKELLPDIIVTDVIMPEMNGFEFCKNIKTDIRTSHIPLLMLTARTTIDDRMEGIELGADAYMVKPFDMRLLRLRLKQLITSRQLIFNKYFSLITEVPANINTTSLDKEFIEKVLSFINDNIGNPDLNVEILASQLNLSKSQFYRKIKALTNQTANEFLRNIRLQKAKQIIEKGNTNISEVCYEIGFSSPSYFTKCFKSHFGVLPSEVNIKKNEL
jgi:signal transduction histidine kinase/ligand-binding sensor domain-containing protein/DNA-binding response OmpR family regulator